MRTSNELNTPYVQYITHVYGNTVWQCGSVGRKIIKIGKYDTENNVYTNTHRVVLCPTVFGYPVPLCTVIF